MGELLYILLGGVFWNNIVLTHLLGLMPFLVERESSLQKTAGMGFMTTILLVAAALFTFIIYDVILVPLGLTYLNNLVLILLLLVLVIFMQMRPQNSSRDRAWHFYLPDVFFNTAVFGMLLLQVAEWDTLVEAVVSAAGVGLGFAILLIIVDSINDRVEKLPVPEWLKGVPIQLIILGILALAVSGFDGI